MKNFMIIFLLTPFLFLFIAREGDKKGMLPDSTCPGTEIGVVETTSSIEKNDTSNFSEIRRALTVAEIHSWLQTNDLGPFLILKKTWYGINSTILYEGERYTILDKVEREKCISIYYEYKNGKAKKRLEIKTNGDIFLGEEKDADSLLKKIYLALKPYQEEPKFPPFFWKRFVLHKTMTKIIEKAMRFTNVNIVGNFEENEIQIFSQNSRVLKATRESSTDSWEILTTMDIEKCPWWKGWYRL